ncbi:hypothetical protein L914_05377, partial [Phytophthora nicotianae]
MFKGVEDALAAAGDQLSMLGGRINAGQPHSRQYLEFSQRGTVGSPCRQITAKRSSWGSVEVQCDDAKLRGHQWGCGGPAAVPISRRK